MNKRKAEVDAAPAAKKVKNAETHDLEDAAKKNLFVGHLSYNIDEEWLAREFEPYGELNRVIHMVDRETQRPRGYVASLSLLIFDLLMGCLQFRVC